MQQTPIHDQHNPDLLRLIPTTADRLIEIGCSSGSLAREFKKLNPDAHYVGIDIDASYAELAGRHCDGTMAVDLDQAGPEFYDSYQDRQVWIFGDTLEHLKNPWQALEAIRAVIPAQGSVVACIPNAQHWSLQVRLCRGDFRYEDSGLLDRTHLRWFTRQTIGELFDHSGFSIVELLPRIFEEPQRENFVQLIGDLAELAGVDPEQAMRDAMPLQYVVRAVPKQA